MSGHSQFKNIMYRKGAQDAKKARVFAKLARDITIAAKSGLPEPDKNPRLRLAIQAARAESMPKDNIERAIAKASHPLAHFLFCERGIFLKEQNLIRYSIQLAFLKQLMERKLITDREYSLIKQRLMKDYRVVSELSS